MGHGMHCMYAPCSSPASTSVWCGSRYLMKLLHLALISFARSLYGPGRRCCTSPCLLRTAWSCTSTRSIRPRAATPGSTSAPLGSARSTRSPGGPTLSSSASSTSRPPSPPTTGRSAAPHCSATRPEAFCLALPFQPISLLSRVHTVTRTTSIIVHRVYSVIYPCTTLYSTICACLIQMRRVDVIEYAGKNGCHLPSAGGRESAGGRWQPHLHLHVLEGRESELKSTPL